jgi:hypothetical protein
MLAEIGWLVTGEKLAAGSILYLDIWDDIAPFSAVVYRIIHEIFGRSVLAYHFISILLVLLQAFIFNTILINTKSFDESSYIPAVVYTLLMSSFIDFNTLSPVLMSITFILLAMNNIFFHVDNKSWVGNLLNTGLYLSVASLFYMPCILFVIPIFLSYILFTGITPRHFLLFLYGVLLPYIFISVYFFWFNALNEFYNHFIYANLFMPGIRFIGLTDFLIISILPIIYLMFSFFKLFEASRYTSYQVRYQQIMFFMLLAAVLSWIFVNKRAPYQLIIFVPFAVFFLSHFFVLIQKKIFAEGLFLLLILYISGMNLGSSYQKVIPQIIDYEELLVTNTPLDEMIKNKKILVLGDDLQYYKNSRLATPYLNWNLAQVHFNNPYYYDNLTAIYSNIKNDLPEIIIDKQDAFAEVINAMPTLQDLYEYQPGTGTYILIQGSDIKISNRLGN